MQIPHHWHLLFLLELRSSPIVLSSCLLHANRYCFGPIKSQLRPAIRSLVGCGTVCKLAYGGPGRHCPGVLLVFRLPSYNNIQQYIFILAQSQVSLPPALATLLAQKTSANHFAASLRLTLSHFHQTLLASGSTVKSSQLTVFTGCAQYGKTQHPNPCHVINPSCVT